MPAVAGRQTQETDVLAESTTGDSWKLELAAPPRALALDSATVIIPLVTVMLVTYVDVGLVTPAEELFRGSTWFVLMYSATDVFADEAILIPSETRARIV